MAFQKLGKNNIFEYLFIFDEVHKCKNISTGNAQLLMSLSNIKNTSILMLSATAVDKIKNFYNILSSPAMPPQTTLTWRFYPRSEYENVVK